MTTSFKNALPHQDTPLFRVLHIIVAVLTLTQIINSNLTESEALGQLSPTGIVTWLHVITGFGLLLCGFIMLFWMLTQRGFQYYFSWMLMDFRGIAEDFRTLRQFSLPEAHSGGMAAVVQGLGVVSLLGVAACGGLWFFLNELFGPDDVLTHQILHLHKFLTVFIETYFWAHGAMGILHILITLHSQQLRKE
ncbi:cytochrome b/b6 domain-containing protein [Klebsiella quasipneumoniae]|uniref:cytochrome b/b6 domain-containing protein n=1 Tax=Klebsiella quasipneumoniae TaxID=1463165 RepID=UPI000DE68EA8|nr:cytochrome b/b6 domain-containing protein [Klebsiella quasipneumoniae]HBR2160078.1 cytochrome b/b6 domain-containing protein [Klebsiella pneumoniae]MEB6030210.1 cytochrome b/b6 domain-containing protein [Klebsiella quasipneumoniae]MEB6157958.1 cytochrome b/b6 domain-containing protein [Klebsiella quasipneumoniae]MEB6586968.1 cytochrome b/b6 domain-containing protein [Klebsiella quasipneumoniae]SSM85251.1 Cytochrome b(N-terminal)/b6/petB [Klebsiella quasipneumoniae]